MQQPLFKNSMALTLRLILFLVISIVAMMLDHRFNHLQQVRDLLFQALHPVRVVVNTPQAFSSWLSQNMATRNTLQDNFNTMYHENLLLRVKQQKLEALELENTRLRKLLSSSTDYNSRVLIAELMAIDTDPYKRQITLDKGTRHGVYLGQPLVDANGIMGQIIQATRDASTALLISDPSHAVPVEVIRNGLRSVASGLGRSDRLELLYIPGSADIRVGDKVVTSGLGDRFPRDYPVALVTQVNHLPGQDFAQVFAEPIASLDHSREVLLLWHQKTSDNAMDEDEPVDNDQQISADAVPTSNDSPST